MECFHYYYVTFLETLHLSIFIKLSVDINNKDIRDANNTHSDSDDEGESMDWWSKYFASLDKMIMVRETENM